MKKISRSEHLIKYPINPLYGSHVHENFRLDKALDAYREFPNRETLEYIADLINWNGCSLHGLPEELVAELVLEGLLDD